MSDQLADFELKLKRALSPVDPPRELEARLELTLGSLVDMAAEELEAWELSDVPRPAQLEPHRAAGRRGGDRLGCGGRARAHPDPAQAAPPAQRGGVRRRPRRAHRARSRARSPARRRRRVLIRERAMARRNEPTMPDDLRALADEDLMQFMRRGEARAFEVLYERHSQAAFSLAYRMAGSRGLAEDVVQEAFVSLWRSGARYERARGSVRTWVLGIVHHRAIDALRRSQVHEKRRTSDEGLEEKLETGERTDAQAARHEEAATLRGALEQLPAEQSRVIELAYFGGFTHTEIADHAGDARRHREGADATRPREDAPRARRGAGEPGMTRFGPDHERWADSVGSYLLGAMPDDELGGFEAHLSECPACRDEVDRAPRGRGRAAGLRAARRAAARAEGPDHGRRRGRGRAARLRRSGGAARPAGAARARAPQLVRLAVAPGRRARLRARAAGRRRRDRRADRRRRRGDAHALRPDRRRRAPRST